MCLQVPTPSGDTWQKTLLISASLLLTSAVLQCKAVKPVTDDVYSKIGTEVIERMGMCDRAPCRCLPGAGTPGRRRGWLPPALQP